MPSKSYDGSRIHIEMEFSNKKPPRLYKTEQIAKKSLKWWLDNDHDVTINNLIPTYNSNRRGKDYKVVKVRILDLSYFVGRTLFDEDSHAR